jgi:hypothetical protein
VSSDGVVGGLTYHAGTMEVKNGRRYVRKKDQHGRKWGMNIEGPDGHHVGVMELQWPRGKARPPIIPPPAYLRHAKALPQGDEDGFVENLVFVDYPAWKNDIRTAWTDFTERVYNEYAERNIECDWAPDGSGAPMRQDVRRVVGPDPDPIEPVLACEQGNRWAIWGEGVMPKALAPWFKAKTKPKGVLGSRELVSFDDFDGEDEPDLMAEASADAERQADAATDLDEAHDPKAALAARLRVAKPSGKNKGGRPKGSKNKTAEDAA